MLIFNTICSLVALILFDFLYVAESNSNLQCLDEDNNPVDWFILYKLPKLKPDENYAGDEDIGRQYLFMTSRTSSGWLKAKYSIDNKESMPGKTLNSLYKIEKRDEIWILYNDQPPKDASKKCGHTKGVVAANKNGGFWMVHSVPRFPELTSRMEYIYPDSGSVNGQTFLCMSLKGSEMEKVGQQLRINQVGVYYTYHNPSLNNFYPTLMSIAKYERQTLTANENSNMVLLRTHQGNMFTSFAKSETYQGDIYEKLVAPQLGNDLLVETWRNGRGALPSDCTPPYSVYNVNNVKLCVKNYECLKFTSTKDHSKWAVSEGNNNAAWVCIGDINRALSQEKRGGGTVCFNNEEVWNVFKTSITGIDGCIKPVSSSKRSSMEAPTTQEPEEDKPRYTKRQRSVSAD